MKLRVCQQLARPVDGPRGSLESGIDPLPVARGNVPPKRRRQPAVHQPYDTFAINRRRYRLPESGLLKPALPRSASLASVQIEHQEVVLEARPDIINLEPSGFDHGCIFCANPVDQVRIAGQKAGYLRVLVSRE